MKYGILLKNIKASMKKSKNVKTKPIDSIRSCKAKTATNNNTAKTNAVRTIRTETIFKYEGKFSLMF